MGNLGEAIKTLRRRRNISQIKLSKLSGISQQYISQLETGLERSFRPSTLNSLARALEVTPEYLARAAGVQYNGNAEPLDLVVGKLFTEMPVFIMCVGDDGMETGECMSVNRNVLTRHKREDLICMRVTKGWDISETRRIEVGDILCIAMNEQPHMKGKEYDKVLYKKDGHFKISFSDGRLDKDMEYVGRIISGSWCYEE